MAITKKLIIDSMLLIFLFSTFTYASAAQFEMLKDTPVSKYNDEDWAMLRKTAREALDNGKDGVKAAWDNPNTGNSGSITPLNTTKRDNMTCRRARFFNSAEGLTGIQRHTFCKEPDWEKWKFAPR